MESRATSRFVRNAVVSIRHVLQAALILIGASACENTETKLEETILSASAHEAPSECPAGMMPSLSSPTCIAVGPTSCATGFVPSSSGWGCDAIAPETPCTGATRAALDEKSCVPVDDCGAAFPPPGAIVVTDDASLTNALTNAKDGAVLALESGTYAGFEVPRDVSIVGRCAEKVIIKGSGQRGIFVTGPKKVSLTSLTVDGFPGGIVASWGADVVASKLIVRSSQLGIVSGEANVHVSGSIIESAKDALIAQKAGHLVFDDGEVRKCATVSAAYDKGTELTLRRSIARYEENVRADALFMTFAASHHLIDESLILIHGATFSLTGRDLPRIKSTAGAQGGHLEVKNSTIRQPHLELDGPLSKILADGHVTLDGTTLEHQAFSAMMVGEPGARLSAKNSVIRGLSPTRDMRNAVWLLEGGFAEIDRSAFVHAQGNALVSAGRGSQMIVTQSLVHETLAGFVGTDDNLGAVGIGITVFDGASSSLADSAIVRSQVFGILTRNANFSMSRSVIDFTMPDPETSAGSAIASNKTSLTIDDSLIRRSADVALVFIEGDGIVKHTRFNGNPVGVHLGQARIVDASANPTTASAGELVFFENVFEGTEMVVRETSDWPSEADFPTPQAR